MKLRLIVQMIFVLLSFQMVGLRADATTYTNTIGMPFVSVPAGSFWLGSCVESSDDLSKKNKQRAFLGLPPLPSFCPDGTTDKEAADDESPRHQVTLSAFQLGVTEVTVGQYKRYLAETGRDISEAFMKKNNLGDTYPVVEVSWTEVQEFIAWLNKAKGESDEGRYRLPTEAEWEYACRSGGKKEVYAGGSDLESVAWHADNSGGALHPVGTKAPNGLGLYDMTGNVWEWLQEKYAKDAYAQHGKQNPTYEGRGTLRVGRGGSWDDSAEKLRCASRDKASPGYRYGSLGFRLLRTP